VGFYSPAESMNLRETEFQHRPSRAMSSGQCNI
jgi:hypothetical protein